MRVTGVEHVARKEHHQDPEGTDREEVGQVLEGREARDGEDREHEVAVDAGEVGLGQEPEPADEPGDGGEAEDGGGEARAAEGTQDRGAGPDQETGEQQDRGERVVSLGEGHGFH